MQNWFQCNFKVRQIDENGYERKVTRVILIDSVSYTEAEARLAGIASEYSGEILKASIKKTNITEILPSEGQWWWKAKINMITIDEEKGREKKTSNYLLVQADNSEEALKVLSDGLSYVLVPYSVVSIGLSPVMDVYPYSE